MKKYKSHSTEYPIAVDKSNPGKVILNSTPTAIIPATETDPQMYEYDVEEYTDIEYATTQAERNSKMIDELIIAILEG